MKKVLSIILLFISSLSFATKYYVKNGGNDAASGLSDALAWETLTKVITIDYNADDTIAFKRGGTWSCATDAQLDFLAGVDGTSGHQVVFTAYGTGAKPIITGRTTITGWNTSGNWTDLGSNRWRFNYGAYTYLDRLWIDDVEQSKNADASVTSSITWHYSSPYLYVYSTSNPATEFSSMEDNGTIDAYTLVYLTGNNYITFSYIDFQGGHVVFQMSGSDYLVLDSCNIGKYTGFFGLYVEDSDHGEAKNCSFDTDCELYSTGWNAEYTNDAFHIFSTSSYWNIHHSYFKNWMHCALNVWCDPPDAISNILFHHNEVTTPDISWGRAFGIAGETSNLSDIEIYNNYIHNISAPNQLEGPLTKVYNNIIDTIQQGYYTANLWDYAGIMVLGSSYAAGSDPEQNEIYHNTIAHCIGPGIYVSWYGYEQGHIKQDNIFKNNICYNNGSGASNYQIAIIDEETVLDQTFQNNLFYSSETNDVVYYGHDAADDYSHTVTEFNAENGTAGDIISGNIGGDPLFINVVNGIEIDSFMIDALSPAVDAGIGAGITYDYYDSLRDENPDIGAFEYGAAEPDIPPDPPTVTTTTPTIIYTRLARSGGSDLDDGGGTISAKGICWSTSINPTTSDSKVSFGTGEDSFSGYIPNLKANTTYHIRAYATNETSTYYGSDIEFTTPVHSTAKTGGKYLKTGNKIVIIH